MFRCAAIRSLAVLLFLAIAGAQVLVLLVTAGLYGWHLNKQLDEYLERRTMHQLSALAGALEQYESDHLMRLVEQPWLL